MVIAVLAAIALLIALTPCVGAEAVVSGTYVYSLTAEGTASVSVMIPNVTGLNTVYIKVDPGILNQSLLIVNGKGDIIPAKLVNSTLVEAVPANQSKELYVRYEAIVGNATGGIVDDILRPGGPAVITLPPNTALLYFNGSPTSVKIVNNQIMLKYGKGGTYEIEFTLPPKKTTTTTSTATTTATAKPVTTTASTTSAVTTAKTTTTTTVATKTKPSTTASTTTAATTTSRTATTATTTVTVTKTTTVTRASTTTASTAPSITTATATSRTTSTHRTHTAGATRTTSRVTSSKVTTPPATHGRSISTATTASHRAPPSPSWIVPAAIGGGIAAAAAIAGGIALRRRGRGSVAGGGSAPAPSGELVRAEELDDRDIEILNALREGRETISSLARKLGLSKSVVWRRVQKLLRMGLINRLDEGGRTYLSLTEEGLRRLNEGGKRWRG